MTKSLLVLFGVLLLSSVSAFVVPQHSAHSFRLFSEGKEKEGKRKKAMDFLKKKGLIRKLVDDGRNVGVDEGERKEEERCEGICASMMPY